MSKEKQDTTAEEQLQDTNAQAEMEASKEDQSVDNQEEMTGEEEPLVKENQELRDKYLRLMAEFDNFKKRNIRERMELMNTAAQDTLTALLPVLDDFDRAQNLSDEQKQTPAYQEGIALVYQKLFNILKQRGLEPMVSTGEEFDPELHEALTEIPAPTEELKGKIVDTIESGYTLKGKIIRHAKVVTGK